MYNIEADPAYELTRQTVTKRWLLTKIEKSLLQLVETFCYLFRLKHVTGHSNEQIHFIFWLCAILWYFRDDKQYFPKFCCQMVVLEELAGKLNLKEVYYRVKPNRLLVETKWSIERERDTEDLR